MRVNPTCTVCGKLLTSDNWWQSFRHNSDYRCIMCGKEVNRLRRRANGGMSMSENVDSSMFLGVHVAEQVLRHMFKNVVQMPYGNHGYDFICGKGYLVDAKASCMIIRDRHSPCWKFTIRKNKIADYFILLAFDNRNDINPLHIWMIPGDVINDSTGVSIATTTLDKWDEYRLDIDKVITCCNAMKEGDI